MTKNKKSPTKSKAARRGQPYELHHDFRLGDKVLIIGIARDLRELNQPPEKKETANIFRLCLGRKFLIRGFDRYGYVEIHVGDDPVARKKFGRNHWIWVEPEFLELVAKSRKIPAALRDNSSWGWREDFEEEEKKYNQQHNRTTSSTTRKRL